MMTPALLSAALILLLSAGTLTEEPKSINIQVMVNDTIHCTPLLIFDVQLAYRGILLGGLKKLMASNANFKFTYSEDPNYGPFLESVNGVAGNDKDHTYWELLVKYKNGSIIRPDVGIGCYIPAENEQIILNFTKL